MIYETELNYLADAYRRELDTEIIHLGKDEKGDDLVYLDSTIFYPHGGGQLSDTGMLVGENGRATVQRARFSQGVVTHHCKIEGDLKTGDRITCQIDWENRYKSMRTHTAGHLLHDAMVKLMGEPYPVPVKGNHGKKSFVEYMADSGISPENREDLERMCNEIIAAGLETHIKSVNLEELKGLCPYVPPNLPKDKPLRVLWVEGYPPFPCGGTHVRSTGEIEHITVWNIGPKRGFTRVRYEVKNKAA